MSLFPAYAENSKDEAVVSEDLPTGSTKQWLQNESFNAQNVTELINVQSETISSSTSSQDEAEETATESAKRKRKKTKHKKSPKKEVISFDENDEFYVDKKPVKMYRSIDTLHKPACPRYSKRIHRCLGWQLWKLQRANKTNLSKRYFKQLKGSFKQEAKNIKLPLSEEEYNSCLCSLNRRIMETADNLQYWLDLIELQERNPYKWSRLLLAEKKLELLERALTHHTRNEHLYRLYIDIVNATYPSFEASKMLDKLLSKDPYNYTLWTAQIMSTQGTMARCIVPDVLQIYARCMQKMHHNAQKRTENNERAQQSDVVMLKLFYNCALFLRQAGLMEMFFALIKLALELNVSTVLFGDFAPAAADQRTLIEYEELVLQSGLPLNEIWLRVEKLRQCFNFLPCPVNAPSSDPQRIVFNEDVCHYIYPLKQRDSVFHMLLLIVRLLKVPFVQTDSLAELFNARVEHIGDSDAIEDVLAICNRNNFLMPAAQHEQFVLSLYELAKEMTITPTFINNSVAHKIYTDFVSQFLLNCAASYEAVDERRRLIFLLIWCRFQRLLIVLQHISGKLMQEEAKLGRQRFKTLLQQSANRNLLPLYIEFALYEYERAPQSLETCLNLFENIISNHQVSDNNADNADFTANLAPLYLHYAEILVAHAAPTAALQLLCCFALKLDVRKKSEIAATSYLAALQRLTEQVQNLLAIEQNVSLMVTEQYLLPDKTVCMVRIVCLMQCLLGHKKQALEQLDKWLKIFSKCKDSARQRFLLEQLHEIYITMAQLPAADYQVATASLAQKIFTALEQFPRNLFLLQQCSTLAISMPWYKIRAAALRNTTTVATVTILIAIIRQRYFQMINSNKLNQLPWLVDNNDRQHAELTMRNRVLDMFKMLVESTQQTQQQHYNSLHRNGLFWRFYLRCLSDQNSNFEAGRNCLLMALDECPWNKSLYLDGATYVPQELPKLQDLIIEKQLRICALPEELEILRE